MRKVNFVASSEFGMLIMMLPLVAANGQAYNYACDNRTSIKCPAVIESPEVGFDTNAFYTFLLSTVFVASVLGNGLVGLVLYRKKQLSPSSRLVFSLCGSNFCLSCFVLPFTLASSVILEWRFGQSWCWLSACLIQVVVSASNMTLAAIAVDRYFAIVKPMSYSVMVTSVKSYLTLLGIWTMSALINVPPLFGWPQTVYEASLSTCRVHIETQQLYAWMLLIIDFIIPAIIMTISYGCIFKVAQSKYKKIHIGTVSASVRQVETPSINLSGTPPLPMGKKQQNPIVRNYVRKPSWLSIVLQSPVKGFAVISCILGVFYLCWVPHIIAVFLTFNHVIDIDSIHRRVTFCIATLSLPCYPLIYGLLNRSIRKDLFTWLKAKKCGQNPMNNTVQSKTKFPRNSSAISACSAASSVTLGLLDYTPPFTQWHYSTTKQSTPKPDHINSQRKMSEDSGRFSLPGDDTDSSSCTSVSVLDNKDWESKGVRKNSMEVLEEEDALALNSLCSIHVEVHLRDTSYSSRTDDSIDDDIILDTNYDINNVNHEVA